MQVGSGTRFLSQFSGQRYTWCFPLCPASLTESCSFSYGLKDLFPLHKLGDKLNLPLTVKTDDVTRSTRDVERQESLWLLAV